MPLVRRPESASRDTEAPLPSEVIRKEPSVFWPDMDALPTIRKCKDCKQPFSSRAKNALRCPPCREKAKKASAEKRWHKKRVRI